MIDLVKKYFGKSTKDTPASQEREASHDIRVATCALLLEMANIDGEFSGAEQKNIFDILKKNYQLSEEHVEALIEASNEEIKGRIDFWQFTHFINQNYSLGEKILIIEMVWEIAYADGRLNKHEDYLVHKLAKLLHLTHKQLIEAKLKIIHGNK
jgi:uncharacterized tellurite resistance protein B-like protein